MRRTSARASLSCLRISLITMKREGESPPGVGPPLKVSAQGGFRGYLLEMKRLFVLTFGNTLNSLPIEVELEDLVVGAIFDSCFDYFFHFFQWFKEQRLAKAAEE